MTEPDLAALFDRSAAEDERPHLAARIQARIETRDRRRGLVIAAALGLGVAAAAGFAGLALVSASVTLVATAAFVIALGALVTARVAQA